MIKIAKALDSFLCDAFEVLEKNIFLKLIAILYIILAVSPFLILFLPIYIFKKIRGKKHNV